MAKAALDQLVAQGLPLKADCQQVWQGFAGWCANDNRVLTALADLTITPPSTWTNPLSRNYRAPFFPPPRVE